MQVLSSSTLWNGVARAEMLTRNRTCGCKLVLTCLPKDHNKAIEDCCRVFASGKVYTVGCEVSVEGYAQ